MNSKRKTILAIIVCLVMVPTLFVAVPASAKTVQNVDLSTWTAEHYAIPGTWTVSADHTSVTTTDNPNPTLFYSDFQAGNKQIEGTIRVNTSSDDDYIGFALGFQPGDTTNSNADYLLIDWKQYTQTTFHGTAYIGLAVSRVKGIPTSTNPQYEFWPHTGAVTELARAATIGSTGWVDYHTYTFRIEFTPTTLKVYVDSNLEIDIKGHFKNGRLAFYNFSQHNVTYSNFTSRTITAGWYKGQKSGWDGSFPPGLDKNG